MCSLALPPEILARVFELGIHERGIGFLPSVARVCKFWNEVVESSPRLWGIISFSNSSDAALELQIRRAKAAPLCLSLTTPRAKMRTKRRQLFEALIELHSNWVELQTTTDTLRECSWSAMTNLEVLTLARGSATAEQANSFFGEGGTFHPKFHTFVAIGQPKAWVSKFLTSSIKHFRLQRYGKYTFPHNVRDTFEYLALLTNAYTIELYDIFHRDTGGLKPSTRRFESLSDLSLLNVQYPQLVLASISAPRLQTLTIHRGRGYSLFPLAPFFSQWSEAQHLPVHLHTLDLKECLGPGDVPFLIRWLRRLPNLIRLCIQDTEVTRTATEGDGEEETFFEALSRPTDTGTGTKAWLLPRLMILELEMDLDMNDLIAIGRARGGRTKSKYETQPDRLRRLEGAICTTGGLKDMNLLRSLVDHIHCTCLGCSFASFDLLDQSS